MIRLHVQTTEQAKETATELVEWLDALRARPDADHETAKCTAEAIRHARALERWLTQHWLDGCRTRGLL